MFGGFCMFRFSFVGGVLDICLYGKQPHFCVIQCADLVSKWSRGNSGRNARLALFEHALFEDFLRATFC
eukprot:10414367-Lingulodinium_polyedra.AAC.1